MNDIQSKILELKITIEECDFEKFKEMLYTTVFSEDDETFHLSNKFLEWIVSIIKDKEIHSIFRRSIINFLELEWVNVPTESSVHILNEMISLVEQEKNPEIVFSMIDFLSNCCDPFQFKKIIDNEFNKPMSLLKDELIFFVEKANNRINQCSKE